MQEAIEFRWDSRRLNWYTGLMALVAAPSLLLLFQPGADVKTLGIAWASACALAAIALQKRKRVSLPVVTVSEQGIFDRRVSETAFAWNAITSVEGFDAEHVQFVGLEFQNPGAALAHCKPLIRIFAPLHRLFKYPSVSINMGLLDGSDADLLQAVCHFRPELNVRAD